MKQEDEMPARIWVDNSLGMVGYVNEPPPPESDFKYEYVRADLLATVRREEREAAFKEVLAITDKHLDAPGFGYLLREKLRIAALEHSANKAQENLNDRRKDSDPQNSFNTR